MASGSRDGQEPRPAFQALGKDAEQYGRVIGIEPAQPVGSEIESNEAVENWLKRLPRAHAAACRMIYLQGKSQDETAAIVGCSKSYLSRLHREAIAWLVFESRAGHVDHATGDANQE